MDKETALKAFRQRCFDLRLPVTLVCSRAKVGVNTPTRWSKDPSQIRASTLKKLEDALDWFENAPPVCVACGKNNQDPLTWACGAYGCGMKV